MKGGGKIGRMGRDEGWGEDRENGEDEEDGEENKRRGR